MIVTFVYEMKVVEHHGEVTVKIGRESFNKYLA